jgi:arylsulfatase
LLAEPEQAAVQAVRPGVLFNYMGASTVDANYLRVALSAPYLGRSRPPLSDAKLDKRGLLSFVFDGRYKFARYYAPTAFNTPQTLEELFKNNDVQLFDLASDPEEIHNLAVEPDRNRATLLRMNGLLNELMEKEVGVNDGRFLAPYMSAK